MRAKFVIILAIVSLNIMAQDVIITKDFQRISAKIDEVSADRIKFHKADNLEGPSYILNTSEIQTITYKNGEMQTFDNVDAVEPRKMHEERKGESINVKRWFGVSIGWVFRERVLKMPGDRIFIDENDHDYGTVRDLKEISYGNTLQVGFTFSPLFKYGIGLYSGLYYERTWAMKQKFTWITGSQTVMYETLPPITITEEQTLSDGTRRRWFGAYVNSLYIPIHFQYQYDINPNMKICISAGPSFEIGLNKPNYRYNKSRFNLLMGGRFGFQMYGAQISIITDWGVLKENFGEAYSRSYAHYHRPISIQMSYMF